MHYHVETGLQGYGPDGDDEPSCFDLIGALRAGVDELERAADDCEQVCSAEMEQLNELDIRELNSAELRSVCNAYSEAWFEHTRADEMSVLAINCQTVAGMMDGTRELAPLYRSIDGGAKLVSRAIALLGDADMLDLSHNSRLYVSEHDGDECEEVDA